MSEPGPDLAVDTKAFDTEIKSKPTARSASPKRAKKARKKNKKIKKVPFNLNITNSELPEYNSLRDEHLQPFFTSKKVRRLLKKHGLITKQGEVIEKKSKSITLQDAKVFNPKSNRFPRDSKSTLVVTYKLPPLNHRPKKPLGALGESGSTEEVKTEPIKVTKKVDLIPYSKKLSEQKFDYFIPRDLKTKKSLSYSELKTSQLSTMRSPRGIKLAPITGVSPIALEKTQETITLENTQNLNNTQKPENPVTNE